MSQRVRRPIVVTAIGKPPPLPLRPVADEILNIWEAQQWESAEQ